MEDSFSIPAERHVAAALNNMRVTSIGDLPKEIRKRLNKEAQEITNKDVFGADHKKDRDGNPIEQGLGSLSQPTQTSIEAYIKEQTQRRQGGPEEGYEENLKVMHARLSEYRAKQKKTRNDDDD